jgi:glycosyltransferase involved in cell wall biosynthesis
MSIKNSLRKLRVALKVLHDDGLLSFTATIFEFIAKQLRSMPKTNETIGGVYTQVKYHDAIAADFHNFQHSWRGTTKERLTFNWLMPPPGKGSGGHINIFRFIKFLEDAGHSCRIYLYSQHGESRISDIRALMGDSYPKVVAEMEWLGESNEMAEADGIFATSWETAYASFNSPNLAKRFYFVQDFEPYFYPIGGLYALAENTYKFNFFGITAGGWLSKKLREDYDMNTDHFDFGSDHTTYSFSNSNVRKEILFYARPYTERRGFEIGIMALDLFHRKHPDYTINMVGYDVSNYSIPFPYNNLKILEIEELNDLYNRCAAGLVLSFTNMSLLPLELLGCGTIPVVNEGENNRLVSNNDYIAYSDDDPVSLAKKLCDIVENPNLSEYSKSAAKSVDTTTWEVAGEKFVRVIEKETRSDG